MIKLLNLIGGGRRRSFTPPEFVASSTGGNNTSVIMTKPTGTIDDDFILTGISSYENDLVVTPPSGWALEGSITTNGEMRLYIYSRVAASEGANWTWGFSRDWNSVFTVTYRNASAVNIFGSFTSAATGNAVASSITPTKRGMLVMAAACRQADTKSWTPPGGMTERVDYGSFNKDRGLLFLGDLVPSSTGATGSKTATPSTADGWVSSVLFQIE